MVKDIKTHWYLLHWLYHDWKIDDYGNIHSVNTLYLIIHSATGYFEEKDEYLILDSTNKYEEVWSRVTSETKGINGGKELFYEKYYSKIKVDTDK